MRSTAAPFALSVLISLFGLQACGGGGARRHGDTQRPLYLQTNLRIHERNATSVNDWRSETVLPVCTPVQIEEIHERSVSFVADGERVRYTLHPSSSLPLEAHVERLFGTACLNITAMSTGDRAGVQQAQPIVGMTRAGVIAALGYPPDHRTVNLEGPEWTYRGHQGNVIVVFDGDVVTTIRGEANEPAVINAQASGIEEQPDDLVAPAPADTVLVTDPTGHPTRVPRSEFNRRCDEMAPCHEPLICITGTCQAAN